MSIADERRAKLDSLAEESRREVTENAPAIEVAWAAWEDAGGEDAPGSRLKAVQSLLGASMVVEAIEVDLDGQECQKAAHGRWQERFLRLHAAVGAEGHLDTVEIRGRRYALFAYPMSG